MAESLFDFTVTQLNGKPVSLLYSYWFLIIWRCEICTIKIIANFLSLDVSRVAAGKGRTSGERGLHVSPNCDGLPGDELSHREGEVYFLR